MEEGAEEFLLKPLQLSDVKKLEPHLQKSLTRCSAEIKEEQTVGFGIEIGIGIGIGITDSDVVDGGNNSDSNKNDNSDLKGDRS